MSDRVYWCDNAFWPVRYGFCPSKEAWERELKRLDADPETTYPDTAGRFTWFSNQDSVVHGLVTVGTRIRSEVLEILAHESVHVYQLIIRTMEEENAGAEIEAYSIQFIFSQLLQGYEKTIGPLTLKD